MSEELNILLEDLFKELDNYLEDYKNIVNNLFNDDKFMTLINKVRVMDNQSNDLVPLKKIIYQDERYNRFLKYENELLYLSLNMSNKLKDLIKENESN